LFFYCFLTEKLIILAAFIAVAAAAGVPYPPPPAYPKAAEVSLRLFFFSRL